MKIKLKNKKFLKKMKNKGDNGFKKIQIVETTFENLESTYDYEYSNKQKFIIRILVISIIILLIIFGGTYFFLGRNKPIRYIKIGGKLEKQRNRTKIENNIIDNNVINNNNKSYDYEQILNNVTKTVQNSISKSADNIKISIIILNNDKEIITNLDSLYESIQSQSFADKEILIIKNGIDLNIKSSNHSEKLEKEATIVEYEKGTGKIMQKYDIVNMAKGEYILFIEGDDAFNNKDVLKQIFETASRDKIDILEYKSYHQTPPKDRIIYQPEIFSLMYFSKDYFNHITQFHLCGKLIKRDFFLNTFKDLKIDPFYFFQNIQSFDQSMILLILFRKAQTFEALDIDGNIKYCKNCEKEQSIPEIKDAVDLLLYMKFLIQYTDDHVPEKRFAVNVFINDFLEKKINFSNKEHLIIINDVFDLYLKCDKIGEEDIIRIEKAKQHYMIK